MTATGLIQSCALVNIDTSPERIAGEFGFAAADEAPYRVCAHGIRSTRLVLTLVDI